MLQKYTPLLLLLFLPVFLFAQVTTGSITGTVKSDTGQPLEGASITATHGPSGTVYHTLSRAGGVFNIINVRIGGPYTITAEYVGYKASEVTNFSVALGETYDVNITMGTDVNVNQQVVVRSTARRAAPERTGAATIITSRQLSTLPTIARSITDFTRLTPQASGNGFAGRDPRYNNLQVDGANLNNNFGLSNDPLPGGGDQPISLDAYDQISVNIAPYDVRQSGFTGAGINAVTKSGTNTFHGTAYGFYRDQTFNGKRVGDANLGTLQFQKRQIFGGSLGGPIIKNKLFFFVNGEYERNTVPGVTYTPTGGSGLGNISSTPIDSLRKLSDYLRTTYGYETGAYDNFPSFKNSNHKLLAKIDWNISTVHKLTIKYSDFKGTQDVQLNGTSVPNGGGFSVTGRTGTLSRLPYNRFSQNSMSYANSNYGFDNIVRTGTIELNSNFAGKMSNQLLGTYTKIHSTRTTPGAIFPTIDIFDGQGNNYMSAGYDPFTYNNDVINNIYSIIDNFTYYKGKHTLTAGASYEYQKVGNMFMPAGASYYAYNSLNDFITNRPPVYYAYTYSLIPNTPNVYSAQLKIGQLGIYAQDEITFNPRFKLTAGLRADVPIYTEKPLENPAITALAFPNKNGDSTHYNTGRWPKARVLLSPRVGFRWDIKGDKSVLLRGGVGVFTGRIPFVFLTNMPTNSGMYQASVRVTDTAQLKNYLFNPDPAAYSGTFPKTPASTAPSSFVMIDRNFRFPQVFRTNLAVDKNLGSGFTLTLEGIYTKDINAVRMRNANLKNPDGTLNGPDKRPFFTSPAFPDRYIYANSSSATTAIVLENTKKGYSYSLTAQLSKAFNNGLYGSVAYTYSVAKEVTANPGSQATSVWNSNPNVGTSNAEELGYSAYAIPHRIVANVSYRIEYANHFATTVSVFYQGSSQGNYSYVINGDLNRDGNNATDLMYIPKTASELTFDTHRGTYNNVAYAYTPEQQQAAFEQFINSVTYLKKHRGEYVERNRVLMPWYNRIDARLLQDFYVVTGKNKTRHTLQFSVDMLNVPNLLSKNWGIQKRVITTNPLVLRGLTADNIPRYNLQTINGALFTQAFQDDVSTNSTWSMQLGLLAY